jgi:TolB protein
MSRVAVPRFTLLLALILILLVFGARLLARASGSGTVIAHKDCRPYLLDLNSGRMEALMPVCAGSLSVSPTGRQIAFTREDRVFIALLSFDAVNNMHRLTSDNAFQVGTSWSPDGEQIAYWTLEPATVSGRVGNLLIGNVHDGSTRALARFTVVHAELTWSPDGNWIAFASSQDGDEEIYIIRVDNGETRQLTHNDFRDNAPAWSPDGQQLVFHSTADGNDELHILNTVSGERYQLTYGMNANAAFWLPDESFIAFTPFNDKLDNEVYVIRPDGTELQRLADFPEGVNLNPTWWP